MVISRKSFSARIKLGYRDIFCFFGSLGLGLWLMTAVILFSFAGCFLPVLYASPWFIFILSLFGLNLFLCALPQFKLNRKKLVFAMIHFSLPLILSGVAITALWGIKGRMELTEGETKSDFSSNRGFLKLPFSVSLEDFALVLYKPDSLSRTYPIINRREGGTFMQTAARSEDAGVVGKALRQGRTTQPQEAEMSSLATRDCRIGSEDKESASPVPRAKAQDGVKEFSSRIRIMDGDEVLIRTVKVNAPVKYKGYTFYQAGYNPEQLNWTSLRVAKDAGAPLVFLGFLMLNAGLVFNFIGRKTI